MQGRLTALGQRMAAELRHNLVPFWLRLHDRDHGGHYGRMDAAGIIDRGAVKPTVFVARLLWFMSTVGRALGDAGCLEQAARTQSFLLDRLRDPVHGGVYWSATHDGHPADPMKHLYAHAFAIYGLATHAMTSGDAEALGAAKELFVLVESRARRADGVYAETFDAAWRPIEDRRLVWQPGPATVTSNAHIHLLEAYTALVRAWPAPEARAALADLASALLDRFVRPAGDSLFQALDANLRPLPAPCSFGHDIEASWLLEDAGDGLLDPALQQRLRPAAERLALAATRGGQQPDGGFLSSPLRPGVPAQPPRVWWVQAEAVLGLVNAALRGGSVDMMNRAEAVWSFIDRSVIDRAGGEWHEAVGPDGAPVPGRLKVGPWKEPYHQARACLEVARRAGVI
jgi:mannobiose 2-epimerase